jgi:MFS family permease
MRMRRRDGEGLGGLGDHAASRHVDGAASGTWSAHLSPIQARLHLDALHLSLVLFGRALGSLVGIQLGGACVERWGSRRATPLSLLACGMAGAGLANFAPLLFSARLERRASATEAAVSRSSPAYAISARSPHRR